MQATKHVYRHCKHCVTVKWLWMHAGTSIAFRGTVIHFKARPPFDHACVHVARNSKKRGEKGDSSIYSWGFCTLELTKIDSVPKSTTSKYIFNGQILHMPTVLTFNPARRANEQPSRKKKVYESKNTWRVDMSHVRAVGWTVRQTWGQEVTSHSLKRHIYMK